MSVKESLDTGDPSQNLANAIIAQAAKDWKAATEYLKKHEGMTGKRVWAAEKTKRECESFFRSDGYTLLTDLDGEYLLSLLKKEAGIA